MKFRLTLGEANSALWQKVEAHLNECLTEYRRQNDDGPGLLEERQTAQLRGRIAMLKEVLALATKPEK